MEKRIYIIGAGFAGQTIADDIKRKKIFGKVNAFIDAYVKLGNKIIMKNIKNKHYHHKKKSIYK